MSRRDAAESTAGPSRLSGSSSRASKQPNGGAGGGVTSLLAPRAPAPAKARAATPPLDAHPHSHLSALLPFQRRILHALVPAPGAPLDDGDVLLILARGLGLRSIVASLLRIYDSPESLVIVLNASEDEAAGIGAELDLMGVRKPGLRVITSDVSAKERNELYTNGGLFSITSRILVTDMLCDNLPTAKVAGLVVLHAETVTSACNEAFITTIYRQKNKDGFMKAFSDEPEHFAIGISPLQTVLGQLRIRNVELWPRFHNSVIRDLGQTKSDVIQLHQPLSRSMRAIQTAIVECLDATLNELKRGTGNVEVEDCTVENAMFRSFDTIVRRQLEPVWHRVGPRTKQLVADLTTLRKLMSYLITYDAVTFLSYLEAILAAQPKAGSVAESKSAGQSPWLFMESANTIFEQAKRRVFLGDVRPEQSAAAPAPAAANAPARNADDVDADEEEAAFGNLNAARFPPATARTKQRRWWLPPGVEPVLEELPKWHLLREVLDEIEQEVHWSDVDLTSTRQNNTILIMTESDRTCNQLREYLSRMEPLVHGGPEGLQDAGPTPGIKMMELRLRSYFYWKRNLGNMTNNLRAGGAGGLGQRSNSNGNAGAGGSTSGAAAGQFESAALKRKDFDRDASAAKRRRQRGGAPGSSGRSVKAKDAPQALDAEANDVADFMNKALQKASEEGALVADDELIPDMSDLHGTSTTVDADADDDEEFAITGFVDNEVNKGPSFTQVEFDNYFGMLSTEDLVVVRPYRGDDDDKMLQELRPRFVIMYDPAPSFVRRLEAYRSTHLGQGVRVYFLLYAESVEEQRYLSMLRREKESFERLIREKSIMALPLQADGRPMGESDSSLRTINSRLAGGQLTVSKEAPRVIVDIRETRSQLPFMLFKAGITVQVCTLLVGDYVLSPQMCVERKTLSDLVQSFNSGRLYGQCELMSAHYQHPILLIEFDEGKSFSLQAFSERKSNKQAKSWESDIQAKLVMLTTAFQRLRVIWSSSPHATSGIFLDLKLNYEEPDVARVAAVGQDAGNNDGTTPMLFEDAGASFNLTPQDMLLALPGISTKNMRFVMSAVKDVAELCDMTLEELQKLIGAEPGRLLHRFVNEDVNKNARLLRPAPGS